MKNMEIRKKETLVMLRSAESIYTLMAASTRLPYVVCDPETYDDEVLLFQNEEPAKKEAQRLQGEGYPVQVLRLQNKALLGFYISLFPMGVNGMLVDKGLETEMALQVEELVKKPKFPGEPKNQPPENPALHLTAIYFMQELRRKGISGMTDELQELNEEMLAHFQRGKYLIAMAENQELPLLKQADGGLFQPIFTDIHEFQKFQNANKAKTLKPLAVEVDKLPEVIAKNASGVALNPFGVNVPLQVKRKEKQ